MSIKNLSGGQRKRVSIAGEILAKPTLLFLDEPTSGLDPGLEERMIKLLRKLADQGRTIVLITHATQNVDRCDHIAFLAPGGYLAYYGPPEATLTYFGVRKFADIYVAIEREEHQATWAQRFQASPEYRGNVSARLTEVGLNKASGVNRADVTIAQKRAPSTQLTSGLRQCIVLSQRYLETIWRDKQNLESLVVQAPIIALLIAIIYHERILDKLVGANLDARTFLFLLALVAVWIGVSSAAREIGKEAAIYARARRVNLKLAPYIASKFTVLTLLS